MIVCIGNVDKASGRGQPAGGLDLARGRRGWPEPRAHQHDGAIRITTTSAPKRARRARARSGCASTARTRAPPATSGAAWAPRPAPMSTRTRAPGASPASATSLAAHAGASWCEPHRGGAPPTAAGHEEDGHGDISAGRCTARKRIAARAHGRVNILTAPNITTERRRRAPRRRDRAERLRIRSIRGSVARFAHGNLLSRDRRLIDER